LAGAQVVPAVHGEQAPALQTWLVPQVVPLATFCRLSTQLD